VVVVFNYFLSLVAIRHEPLVVLTDVIVQFINLLKYITMTNRRNFLRNASLLTAGGLLAGRSGQAAAARPAVAGPQAAKKIGLQIYSLGQELFEDVPGGLKKLSQYGYKTLELAGYNDGKIGKLPMPEFKKLSDDAGLKIISSHLNPPVREYTKKNLQQIKDFWKKAVDEHARIDVPYVVQPGQPATRSIEETSYVGEVFTEAGKIAKAAGLSFGYHNHHMEFARVIAGGKESIFGHGVPKKKPSEIIYDLFVKNTDPAYVFFELDVYWIIMGQQDPVEYLKKYPTRIKLLHIKDKEVLGESGMMNFENIFKQAYVNGIEDWFVELEGLRSRPTQFEGVKDCASYLLKAEFVK
jgi:sugar phosphate isomerase/epimerase